MPPKASRASRALSEMSEHEYSEEDGAHAGGASSGTSNARSKGKASADGKPEDQRKIQNRLAQREFRQRKQEYIRTLEAKVKTYESSRDGQIDGFHKAIEALLEENQKLRELLAGVSAFIGEGIGGYLPRLGIEAPEFQDLLNRKSTTRLQDILLEGDGGAGGGAASHGPSTSASTSAGHTSKRPRLSDTASPRDCGMQEGTAARPGAYQPQPPMYQPPAHSYDMPMPSLAPTPSAGSYPVLPPIATSLPPLATSSAPQQRAYPPSSATSLPSMLHSSDRATTGPAYSNLRDSPGQAQQRISSPDIPRDQQQPHSNPEADKIFQKATSHILKDPDDIRKGENVIQELFNTPTDDTKLQAIQLVSYHMRNKRDNPSYHLPPSLRATVTQQTVPHSPVFDGIIWSSLRDRLILLKDQYDLHTLLTDLLAAFELHGEDVLMPSNWELGEPFLRKYWYVIDPEVLAISNRWRKERGEPELTMRSIIPDGDGLPAEGALGARARAGK